MRFIGLLGLMLLACAAGKAFGDDAAPKSAGLNQFGADLYGQLAKGQGNVICSPASVYSMLAMVAEGARGQTADEFGKVLGEYRQNALGLMGTLQKADENFELHAANALWAQNGFACLPDYQKILTDEYKCDYFNIDFLDPSAASRSINDWVAKATSGKITDLFPEGSLPRGAKLVLTNAIYFHADWRSKFPGHRTGLGEFHVDGKAEAQERTMMHENGSFGFLRGDDFDAIELPYKGDEVGMLILLPHSVDGLKELEGKFSGKMLADVMAGLKPEAADVSIPKFEFSSRADLPEALKALGIRQAFEAGGADFSGIDGKADLFLSDVKHKALVAVDEEGTTAAAATGGVMMPTAIPVANERFNADHPFMFVIVDHRSGAGLFMGRVVDPGAK